MAFGEIVNAVLNYQILGLNIGPGDFVLGLSVAGAVVLVALAYAWKRWGHNLPLIKKSK